MTTATAGTIGYLEQLDRQRAEEGRAPERNLSPGEGGAYIVAAWNS